MRRPIFQDHDGCSRSIRSNCIQPTITDKVTLDRISGSSIYTAIMEVYETDNTILEP